MASADLHNLPTALLGEGHSGGIMEVGEAVEELDTASFAFEADDRLLQRLRDDAPGINGHLLHIGLVGREDRQ